MSDEERCARIVELVRQIDEGFSELETLIRGYDDAPPILDAIEQTCGPRESMIIDTLSWANERRKQ